MRKSTIATLVVAALAAAVLVGVVYVPRAGQAGIVRELSERFVQDLQYKDFRSSSLYSHDLDRARLDIGSTLEKLFLVKPELFDLMRYEVVRADVDESGERARTKVRVVYKKLNISAEPAEKEVLLYWLKRHPDCPIGGTCAERGVCVDERAEEMKRPKDDSDRAKTSKRSPADEAVERGEESFPCDPTEAVKWTMNLDSTLDAKPYQ
ncbi:MAG: hypothetical protein AAGI01_04945 [Myxococcota bacterium]